MPARMWLRAGIRDFPHCIHDCIGGYMKRIAACMLNYCKLFLMPFLLVAFIGGCLYRVCRGFIRSFRAV